MTVDELNKLDNYGHRRLNELTEAQLREYLTLLEKRALEVFKYISELKKGKGAR